MKYLLLIALLSVNAYAGKNCSTTNESEQVTETILITSDVPEFLKGATITITKANGESSTVKAEQFKVVARKQQRVVSKVLATETMTCLEGANYKNRISILGGYGPSGDLSRHTSANKVDVNTKTGFNAGFQYQRNIFDDISVGAQVQSNKAGSLMIGKDF